MLNFLMNHSTETGLVMFFVCFAAIALFAATRSHRQLDGWARLPLGSNDADEALPNDKVSDPNHSNDVPPPETK